jgi:hypothetical protein
MSQFTRQFYGRVIDYGLNATATIEPVKVTLPIPGSIDSGLAALPLRGTLHPNQQLYPGMVLERIRLRTWMNRETALYDLIYRRQLTGYSGGPRAISRVTVYPRIILIPVWEAYTPTVGPASYRENPRPFERSTIQRVHAAFVTNTIQQVQDRIAENVGRLYVINAQEYIFDGGNAATDGLGYTRAEYHFRTNAPIAPIGIGVMGNAIAIPQLPILHEYVSNGSAYPPTVGVVGPASMALPPGNPLPGFP